MKSGEFYMLYLVIYTYEHGGNVDLLYHLYKQKHKGGRYGYQSVDGKMLFHLHVSLVRPASPDACSELLSFSCPLGSP